MRRNLQKGHWKAKNVIKYAYGRKTDKIPKVLQR
jgi:hypothetical protein